MPIKFIAPGARGKGAAKHNRFWYVRGTIAGRRIEISTGQINKADAERVAPALIAAAIERDPPAPGDAEVTFRRAADAYVAWRRPSAREHAWIDALTGELGQRRLDQINHAALVETADRLYPDSKPQSKNRCVIAPAAAILHYAADNGWIAYQRIKRFREPPPATRAVDPGNVAALIALAAGELRLLLIFLFGQGTRITDTLRLDWRDIDLDAAIFRVHVSKTQTTLTLPLAADVRAALSTIPADRRAGPIFPSFKTRWQVYAAIAPLREQLGVTFTPHMARHTLGARLNAQGAGLRTIMDALGHRNVKSSLRYQSTTIDTVRAALDGKNPGVARKLRKVKA